MVASWKDRKALAAAIKPISTPHRPPRPRWTHSRPAPGANATRPRSRPGDAPGRAWFRSSRSRPTCGGW